MGVLPTAERATRRVQSPAVHLAVPSLSSCTTAVSFHLFVRLDFLCASAICTCWPAVVHRQIRILANMVSMQAHAGLLLLPA
jgi:hypothetical protein